MFEVVLVNLVIVFFLMKIFSFQTKVFCCKSLQPKSPNLQFIVLGFKNYCTLWDTIQHPFFSSRLSLTEILFNPGYI